MEPEKNRGGHPGGPNMNPDTPFTAEQRLKIIKLNVGKSYAELMRMCRCSMSTIYLDMKKWRASGGFEDFLQQEFLELHTVMKADGAEVPYKTISILLGKYIPKRIDAEVTHDVSEEWTAAMKKTFGLERKDDDGAPGETPGESV